MKTNLLLLISLFYFNPDMNLLVGQVKMDSVKIGADGQISFNSHQSPTNVSSADSLWKKVTISIHAVVESPSISLPTGNMVMRGDGFKKEVKEVYPAEGNVILIIGLEIVNNNTATILFNKENVTISDDANLLTKPLYLEKSVTGGVSKLATTYEIRPSLNANESKDLFFIVTEVPLTSLSTLEIHLGSRNIGNLSGFPKWKEYVGTKDYFLIKSSFQPLSVLECQSFLKKHGYEPGKLDGKWGEMTESALKRFQKDHNLFESGKLDTKTINKIHSIKNE